MFDRSAAAYKLAEFIGTKKLGPKIIYSALNSSIVSQVSQAAIECNLKIALNSFLLNITPSSKSVQAFVTQPNEIGLRFDD
jgi:hypothetical protein